MTSNSHTASYLLLVFYFGFILFYSDALFHEPRWDQYHNSSQLATVLEQIHSRCPNVTRVYYLNAGHITLTASQRHHLWVIEFATIPGIHTPGVPEFKYIANMHGDESIGRELLIRLAFHLCEMYRNSSQVAEFIIKNTRIHLMPSMNPDGFDYAVMNPGKKRNLGRLNANHVDLNRNFPLLDAMVFRNMEMRDNGPFDHLRSHTSLSDLLQPETRMVMQWLSDINFVLSANLHGGSLVANYPYDTSPDQRTHFTQTPDHNIFIELAHSYADFYPEMHDGTVHCGTDEGNFDEGTVNGAAWYPINGSMQDYNYLATNTFEITVELGCVKFPPPESLPMEWHSNKDSLLNFILQVHRGIKGEVIGFDGLAMHPIANAVVKVFNITTTGHVHWIAHNIWTGINGDYYRLLTKGDYAVLFEASGYYSASTCVRIDNIPKLDESLETAQVLSALLIKTDVHETLFKNMPAGSENFAAVSFQRSECWPTEY